VSDQKSKALASFEEMNKKICHSAAELNKVLRSMAELLPEMVDDLLRNVVETLYLGLAGEGSPPTPIRTGRARTGWTLDTKESEWLPPDMESSPKSESEILMAVREAIGRLPRSELYYLYNNVPYILRLERGHSAQAPQGFIALALAQVTKELEKKVAELNNAGS
jgi:hypothetical protein